MAETARSEAKARSHQSSPVPRRELGSLSVNQRSYSRMSSSKGMYGDESPLLSPLPYYPKRRSVTFAGAGDFREERPNYGAMYSASAPVSPVRKGSPPPVGILKRGTATAAAATAGADEEEGARPDGPTESPHDAAAALSHIGAAVRTSPVPRRGRSTSRQRLAARRREAQLHHSFYDDSFVEEFVLSSKEQLEKEEAEARRLEEKMEAEKEKARRAERKMVDATDKFNALQHAKEVLLAAAQRRRSTTPTPSPARASSRAEGKHSAAGKETDLLQSLEEDSDPEIQSALAELSRIADRSEESRRSRRATRQRRSVPIVSDNVYLGDSYADNDGGEDSDAARSRKRAKLERIVSDILSQQEKRGKSKRSVVVINWSDAEEDSAEDSGEAEEEGEEREGRVRATKRPRPAATKSRGVALASGATVVPARGGRRPSAPRRAASSRKRNESVAPDISDSVLFENEEDQPILLPRRTQRRPAPTRSISALNAAADDLLLSEDEEAVRRVTRRAPRTDRPAAKKASANVSAHRFASARAAQTASSAVHDDDTFGADDAMTPPHAPPAAAPARRRRTAAAPARGVPKVSPDDPMSVFFDAAFPSPSKFDEMMQQAGGLPESRRANGNRGRQPNLVLPSSIGRRR